MNSQETCPAPLDDVVETCSTSGDKADEQLAVMSKALGHPARVQIFRILSRRESCICGDFVVEIGLAQSTISQHLKVLKKAGLVRGTVSGPSVCYCVNPSGLTRLKNLVQGI